MICTRRLKIILWLITVLLIISGLVVWCFNGSTIEPVEVVEEPIIEEVEIKEDIKQENTSQNVKITPKIEPQSKNEVELSNSSSNIKTFRVTAYCPCSKCCGKWANGITATGVIAQANHTIAVDPKTIPYGSIVRINGIDYVAEDCGGAIKGNRIDIYFDTHEEAMAFGVQYLEGEIIS